MISQVWPQEKIKEKLRKKTKFMILTGPRDWRHGHIRKTPGWSRGRRGRIEGELRPQCLFGFPQER